MRVLLWLFYLLCLTIPFSFVVTKLFEMPISTIFSGVWGMGCGFILSKLLFTGE